MRVSASREGPNGTNLAGAPVAAWAGEETRTRVAATRAAQSVAMLACRRRSAFTTSILRTIEPAAILPTAGVGAHGSWDPPRLGEAPRQRPSSNPKAVVASHPVLRNPAAMPFT